jgi:hypothetical protein
MPGCFYFSLPHFIIFACAGVMGCSEARRQENLRDERDTIGQIKEGKEDGCAVMFFGEQTCAIMPVDRVEPHACVTDEHAETFRTWIWEASVSQQVHEGWDEFPDEIRNRFDRAFDIANQYASRQSVVESGPEFVMLSGCVTEGGAQNGLLPCGALVWCCVENEPVWPCRVVGLRANAYKKLREEALALGYDIKEKTEPVLFFGEDSNSPPPPPVLASLSDCSVFIPGEDKRWIPHYRLRSLKIANEREFRPWSEDIWDNWDVACEIACDCARARSIDPIYEWMSQPSSLARRRNRNVVEVISDPEEVCDIERLQLGHGPFVNGLGSRETSPSMSSSLPLVTRMNGTALHPDPANGISKHAKNVRSARKTARNSTRVATEKASPKKSTRKKKSAPVSPVLITPKSSKSISAQKSTGKKGRAKKILPRTPDTGGELQRSRIQVQRQASQLSVPPPVFEQFPAANRLHSWSPSAGIVAPEPGRVIGKSLSRFGSAVGEQGPSNIAHSSGYFRAAEPAPVSQGAEPLQLGARSADIGPSSEARWPAVPATQPVQRGGTSGIRDIYSECGY